MEAAEWSAWAGELDGKIAKWLEEEAVKEEGGYHCKRCGKDLMNRTVYCSVHDGFSLFGTHAGCGQVHRLHIPECPNKDCQNHRPGFWDGNLNLNEVSDTLYGPCYDC